MVVVTIFYCYLKAYKCDKHIREPPSLQSHCVVMRQKNDHIKETDKDPALRRAGVFQPYDPFSFFLSFLLYL